MAARATEKVRLEVVLVIGDGVVRRRMLIVARGEQHVGAQVNVVSPPLAQQIRAKLDVPDVLSVLGRLDRWDSLRQAYWDGAVRATDRDTLWPAVEIARRAVPVLAFPLIHVGLDGWPSARWNVV